MKPTNLGKLAGTIVAGACIILVLAILFSVAIKLIIFIWTGEW